MTAVRTWIDRLGELAPSTTPPERVVLSHYPVQLGKRQGERSHQLMAELAELAETGALSTARMRAPRRLRDLAERLVGEFGDAVAEAARRHEEAEAAGLTHVDLSYPVTSGTRRLVLEYGRLMEQVDVCSRAGILRTPPPDVTLYTLRRWTVEECLRQLAGHDPRPWDGPAD